MNTEFIAGKLYRWVGPDKPSEWGISSRDSAEWEKGEPHRRLYVSPGFFWVAGFEGIKTDWSYGEHFHNFEEVTK